MSDMELKVDVKTEAIFNLKEDLLNKLDPSEIAGLVSIIAEFVDDDFRARKKVADTFADGLSEMSVRLLAEVVTSFYARQK